MDVSRRRPGVKSNVVAGSVWESRMKSDQVKAAGIKLFSSGNGLEGGDEVDTASTAEEDSKSTDSDTTGKHSPAKPKKIGTPVANGKRKTGKSESTEGAVQVASARAKSESSSLSTTAMVVKETRVSVSADGVKRSLVMTAAAKKGKMDIAQRASPVPARRSRSDVTKGSDQRNSVELRKSKSDSAKILDQSTKDADNVDGDKEEEGGETDRARLRKAESIDEPRVEEEAVDSAIGTKKEDPVEIAENVAEADEICKEFGVCREVISSNVTQSHANSAQIVHVPSEDDNVTDEGESREESEEEEEEEKEEEGEEEEEEVEELEGGGGGGEGSDEGSREIEGAENKRSDIKEIVLEERKQSNVVGAVMEEEQGKKKHDQITEKPRSKPRPVSSSVVADSKQPPPPPVTVVKKQTAVHRNIANPTPALSKTIPSNANKVRSIRTQHPPPPPSAPRTVTKRSPLHQNYASPGSFSDEFRSSPSRQNKLQSLVDLVMWRDVSRSTLIFGLGTFMVISSSYTKDLNFSCISVISYLGLFYLAAIFLYRSLICRGYVDNMDDTSSVLGEEEAVWLLRLVLPYLNEFLLKLKALFSGDPATTMKLAVLLFVMARCGSSVTIWKMAKFGFFGVFTVPKVCSSYSHQIKAHGKFWVRRFRDAWNSCSHKKAVAVGIFTLIWNLCSVVARIWAVFMLFVAFRYYQQNLAREEWAENGVGEDGGDNKHCGGAEHSFGPSVVQSSAGKKAS